MSEQALPRVSEQAQPRVSDVGESRLSQSARDGPAPHLSEYSRDEVNVASSCDDLEEPPQKVSVDFESVLSSEECIFRWFVVVCVCVCACVCAAFQCGVIFELRNILYAWGKTLKGLV